MTKEDQKRDKYYRKRYGVGLDWYNARLKEQGGCCAICKRPASVFKKRLAVDHDHSWKKVCIAFMKLETKWCAMATYLGYNFTSSAKDKPTARKGLKEILKKLSARGLVCGFCNRGMRYYMDIPERMKAAGEYLRRHQNGELVKLCQGS